MKRRDFSALVGSAALAGLALPPQFALAQGGVPAEGRQFMRLGTPVPTPPGKIEVVEFFWYGCPHCFAFDPALEEWVKRLPADVAFRRVHVGFNGMIKLHQKLFFALEAMGEQQRVHQAVFNAFHREGLDLSSEAQITAMVTRLGVDAAKFKAAFNSFGVATKAQQATKMSEAFGIDGVPALGIAGRYWTSPGKAGTRGQSEVAMGLQALGVADYLIQQARAGK